MLRLSDISSGSVLANWTLSSGKKEFVQLLIADYNPRRFPNESHFIPIKVGAVVAVAAASTAFQRH